jgi:hypothetical protein
MEHGSVGLLRLRRIVALSPKTGRLFAQAATFFGEFEGEDSTVSGRRLKTLETKCFLPHALNANNCHTIPWQRIHPCGRRFKKENDPCFVKAGLERLSPIRQKWVRLHFIRRALSDSPQKRLLLLRLTLCPGYVEATLAPNRLLSRPSREPSLQSLGDW